MSGDIFGGCDSGEGCCSWRPGAEARGAAKHPAARPQQRMIAPYVPSAKVDKPPWVQLYEQMPLGTVTTIWGL